MNYSQTYTKNRRAADSFQKQIAFIYRRILEILESAFEKRNKGDYPTFVKETNRAIDLLGKLSCIFQGGEDEPGEAGEISQKWQNHFLSAISSVRAFSCDPTEMELKKLLNFFWMMENAWLEADKDIKVNVTPVTLESFEKNIPGHDSFSL